MRDSDCHRGFDRDDREGFPAKLEVFDRSFLGIQADIEVLQRVPILEREIDKLRLLFDKSDKLSEFGLVVDFDARLPVRRPQPNLDLHFAMRSHQNAVRKRGTR